MKKFIYYSLFAVCLASCTADDPMQNETSGIPPISISETRTASEAIEIASAVSSTFLPDGNASLSRSGGRVVDPGRAVYTIHNPASRSGNTDPLLYIVNYAENKGFAIVPTNRNAPDVIAVTENGHYNPAEGVEIGGFNEWLEDITEYLVKLESEEQPVAYASGALRKVVTDTIFNRTVDPRIEVIWGQSNKTLDNPCESMFFDNENAGCANVAIAMVMSYLEKPLSLRTTYLAPENNFDFRLRWDELKKYMSVHDNPPQVFPQAEYPGYSIRTSLGYLLRELAQRNNSTFRDSLTTVSPNNFANTVRQFELTSAPSWEFADSTSCHDILFNYGGSVLFVGGYENDYKNGHVWVCDGMKNFRLRDRIYESTDNGVTWNLIDTSYSKYYRYVHYNWGWHGNCNGFYLDSATEAIPGGPDSGNTAVYDFFFMRTYMAIYR